MHVHAEMFSFSVFFSVFSVSEFNYMFFGRSYFLAGHCSQVSDVVHWPIVMISQLYGRQKPQVEGLVCRIETEYRRMTTKLESNHQKVLYADSAHDITYFDKYIRRFHLLLFLVIHVLIT